MNLSWICVGVILLCLLGLAVAVYRNDGNPFDLEDDEIETDRTAKTPK